VGISEWRGGQEERKGLTVIDGDSRGNYVEHDTK